MSAPYIELQNPISEYSFMCRGCLADSGEMKNMVEWGLVDEFLKYTDVEVSNIDGLSQLLCNSCEEALASCKRFREQCQQSNVLLKNKIQNEEIATESVQQESELENTAICEFSQYNQKLLFLITAPNTEATIYLNCPFNCRKRFQKKKDLQFHLLKMHEVDKNIAIDLQYHCSHSNCHYHVKNEKKYFTKRKYLNQHFNKVHKSKDVKCEKCNQSFINSSHFYKHLDTCNVIYTCQVCSKNYKVHEQLIVHLMRNHPEAHKQYKESRALKRKLNSKFENKKQKTDAEKLNEFFCDSPKRTSATQTSKLQDGLKNDVIFWKNDTFETKKDEISTQTVFEDLLSLKSVTSEDDSIFFSETVSLSDIQTQTLPIDFGRSHKETITETRYPDLTIKETQTCCCLESPKLLKLYDGLSKSTETQTAERLMVKSDVLLSCSTETQTCFDGDFDKNSL